MISRPSSFTIWTKVSTSLSLWRICTTMSRSSASSWACNAEPSAIRNPVNVEASASMGRLHDALKVSGYGGHDLEVFLVRTVFCLLRRRHRHL